MPTPIFVLIHSPLVGPATWRRVASELKKRGQQAIVPVLDSSRKQAPAYWQQHANAAADALASTQKDVPVVLVGHSGAGPLLPAIRQALPQPAAGYIFVDAGLPQNGKSRLDQFYDPAEVEQFRQSAQNGLLPVWTNDDLRPVIPDDAIRAAFAGELSPLPLEVYEEPLPVFDGWPDAPCGYIRFGSNPAYDIAFQQAQDKGCEIMKMPGKHFHMLVDPVAVTDQLINLAQRLNRKKE